MRNNQRNMIPLELLEQIASRSVSKDLPGEKSPVLQRLTWKAIASNLVGEFLPHWRGTDAVPMPRDQDPDWLCAKRRYSVHFTFPRPRRPRAALIFQIHFVFLVVVALGCGGSGPVESPEAGHIGKVGQLATEFKNVNSGNNPKNIDELKSWAVKNGK